MNPVEDELTPSTIKIFDGQTLHDMTGVNGIILVFVPDTKGISSQLQLKDIRNNYHKIRSYGLNVLIISSESEENIDIHTEELSLSFPVYHDHDNHLSKLFNTLGKQFQNPYISERTKRRTFILNQKLQTKHVIDDIHPGSHTDDILNYLNKNSSKLAVDGSSEQTIHSRE